MKVIDFDTRGNVIRLYFGDDNDKKYWGDDWDDTPYEHNAGTVYEKYIVDIKEYAFLYDYGVFEPASDWHYNGNSPFNKEDMKKGKCPCIIIKKTNNWDDCYCKHLGNKKNNILKIYFNDDFNVIDNKIKKFGGVCLK
jgi:hypothetical protein